MTAPTPTDDLVADLARRLGVDTTDPATAEHLADAIDDAEADVEGYLGRSPYPEQRTKTGCWPEIGGWYIPGEHDTIREIISTTPEYLPDQPTVESGTFTIVYTVGIDYLADNLRPIRRYVLAAAANDPALTRYLVNTLGLRGLVQSVSVGTEGQSKNVTYRQGALMGGGGDAGKDSPGALPPKSSMDKWRVANRRVHQAPTQRGPWGRWHERWRESFW